MHAESKASLTSAPEGLISSCSGSSFPVKISSHQKESTASGDSISIAISADSINTTRSHLPTGNINVSQSKAALTSAPEGLISCCSGSSFPVKISSHQKESTASGDSISIAISTDSINTTRSHLSTGNINVNPALDMNHQPGLITDDYCDSMSSSAHTESLEELSKKWLDKFSLNPQTVLVDSTAGPQVDELHVSQDSIDSFSYVKEPPIVSTNHPVDVFLPFPFAMTVIDGKVATSKLEDSFSYQDDASNRLT